MIRFHLKITKFYRFGVFVTVSWLLLLWIDL
jgi:hypothetical protein